MSNRICKVNGCNKKVKAMGYCSKHYEIDRRNRKGEVCRIDGCSKFTHANGLCNSHYSKERRVSDIKCKVEECQNMSMKHSEYCNKHYLQKNRHGETLSRTRFDMNEIRIVNGKAVMELYNKDGDIVNHTTFDKIHVDESIPEFMREENDE